MYNDNIFQMKGSELKKKCSTFKCITGVDNKWCKKCNWPRESQSNCACMVHIYSSNLILQFVQCQSYLTPLVLRSHRAVLTHTLWSR